MDVSYFVTNGKSLPFQSFVGINDNCPFATDLPTIPRLSARKVSITKLCLYFSNVGIEWDRHRETFHRSHESPGGQD